MWMNEMKQKEQKKTKVTSYSNWQRVLLFDLAKKQRKVSLKDGITVWRQSQK